MSGLTGHRARVSGGLNHKHIFLEASNLVFPVSCSPRASPAADTVLLATVIVDLRF